MMPSRLILAPVDFRDISRNALDVATYIASLLDAALLLAHIVPAIPDLRKASRFSRKASTVVNLTK